MPTGIGSGIAGEVFTDQIGSGSGGSIICPTRYSVNLNGVTQLGLTTGTSFAGGVDNFSYSFWFKSSASAISGIVRTDSTANKMNIFLSAAGLLTVTWTTVTFPTTASLNDGEWHHAVLSVDRLGYWRWYIDGVNTNSADHSSLSGDPVSTINAAWGTLTGNGDYFDGNLTELSIWGTALSSSEVLTIYNNMFGSQTCLTDLTFGSGNLIQNGSFNQIGPQLIDNPTFNAPTSPNLVDNPNFTDTGTDLVVDGDFPLPNVNWSAQGGAEITIDGARINNTISGVNAYIAQLLSGTLSGKSFVLTYDVITTNGTTLAIEQATSISLDTSTTGTNRKLYFTWNRANNGLILKRLTLGTDVTIDNVSVKELGADWTVINDGTASTYFGENKVQLVTSGDYTDVAQLQTIDLGASYKYSFEIVDYVSGSAFFQIGGVNVVSGINADGVYSGYYTSPTGNDHFLFKRGGATNLGITNVSVQEVDWNFGGGWSLGSNKALATAAVGGDTLSQTGVFTLDKSYKTTFLSTLDSGSCFAKFGSDGFIGQLPSGTASNLFYYQTNEVGDSARIAFEVQSLMMGSISNVLTYQMDPNGYWNIPTANSTQLVLNPTFTNTGPEEVTNGDFSQTALGSEEIVDGSFPNGSTAWSEIDGGTIVDNQMVLDCGNATNAYTFQSNSTAYTLGKTYQVTVTIASNTTGVSLILYPFSASPYTSVITVGETAGTYTVSFVPDYTSGSGKTFALRALSSTGVLVIDSVSVKEVLQLVTNGDFTEGTEGVAGGNFESGLIGTVANTGGTVYTWALNTVAPISGTQDGLLSITSVGTNVSHPRLQFDGTLALDESFVLTFDYKVNSGTCEFSSIRTGGVSSVNFPTVTLTGSGTYTFYFQGEGTGLLTINFDGTNLFDTQFDNISVKKLGADWTIYNGGTASSYFGENKVQLVTSGDFTSIVQLQTIDVGKSYKYSFEIVDFVTGSAIFQIGGATVAIETGNGVYSGYYTSPTGNDHFEFKRGGATDLGITNISVQELGEGWTINNADATHYVEFIETGARFVSDTISPVLTLRQDVVDSGKFYKITCNATYAVGSGKARFSIGSINTSAIEEGNNTIYLSTPTTTSTSYILRNSENVDVVLTNISIEETGLDWVSPDAGVVNTFSATGLTMTSVNGAGDNTIRQDNVTADDQAYKVDYTIVGSSLTAGNYLQFYNGATYVNMKTSVGSHTLHFTRSGADDSVYLRLASNDGSLTDTVDIGSITIVEVQGWTLEDGKLVGDLPDLAKSATQDIGAIAGNSYKATMDVALAEEELITNGSFREVGADLVLAGDFPLPNYYWLKAASTTINGGSATFGGLGTVADMLAGAFALRVEADGGVVEAQSCLISDLTFLTENP